MNPAETREPTVTITYYTEVFSSWCWYVEPAWAALKRQYAGCVSFRWRVAAMKPEDFPLSAAQADWFYQRSRSVMNAGRSMTSGWFQPELKGAYEVPNLVAEAARELMTDPEDDRVRLALAEAVLYDGKKLGADFAASADIGAQAAVLDAVKLAELAKSPAVRERVTASTAEFFAHQLNQRPAFVLTSVIGDKAVFSGMVRLDPLQAAIEAMLTDADRYATFAAQRGTPPTT